MIIALGALPPDFLRRTRMDIVRSKVFILRRMPLASQLRIQSGKTVGFDDLVVRANSATDASMPVRNRRVPFVVVSLGTFPPSLKSRTYAHVVRRDSSVFRRVPLFCQFRVYVRKALAGFWF